MVKVAEKTGRQQETASAVRSAHPATVAARLYQCWKCGGNCRLWQASHEFRWFYLTNPSSHCVADKQRWAYENPAPGLMAS